MSESASISPGAAGVDAAGEHEVKRARVLDILDQAGVDAVLLTGSTTLGWYLGGARSHVSLAADPILCVRVGRDGDEVFVTDNETARLVAEELPAGIPVRDRPWFGAPGDLQAVPEAALADQLRAARSPLLPVEAERFRRLGQDAAEVATEVLSAAEPSWTEHRLAAELARGVMERGADPLVVLVGGEQRSDFPHPLPTAAPLGRRALAVVCARRHGLIVNLSRSVVFGSLSAAEREGEQAIFAVERAALDATLPGSSLAEVLAVIAQAYADNGFHPDHWRRHHQGGVAGYAGRDPRATPDARDVVQVGQAFAWNPWAPSAKVEDTVLLGADGIEILTVDPRWPVVDVGGRLRPVTLVR